MKNAAIQAWLVLAVILAVALFAPHLAIDLFMLMSQS